MSKRIIIITSIAVILLSLSVAYKQTAPKNSVLPTPVEQLEPPQTSSIITFRINETDTLITFELMEINPHVKGLFGPGGPVKEINVPTGGFSPRQSDLAFLLQNRKYKTIQKNGVYFNDYTIREWKYRCGLVCGEGGREFVLPDGTVFFKIQDWIS